jgi:hypothetical protein
VILGEAGMAIEHLTLHTVPGGPLGSAAVTQAAVGLAVRGEVGQICQVSHRGQEEIGDGRLKAERFADALAALFCVAEDNVLQSEILGQGFHFLVGHIYNFSARRTFQTCNGNENKSN